MSKNADEGLMDLIESVMRQLAGEEEEVGSSQVVTKQYLDCIPTKNIVKNTFQAAQAFLEVPVEEPEIIHVSFF